MNAESKKQALYSIANAAIWATVILTAAALGAPNMLTTVFLPALAINIQFFITQKSRNRRKLC